MASGQMTVTGDGIQINWTLVSPEYSNLKMMSLPQIVECPTHPLGYVIVNVPDYPTKTLTASWDGTNLWVKWTPLWDYNGDGKIDLRDLASFGKEFVQGKWSLSDFARFAELYNRPCGYVWQYISG